MRKQNRVNRKWTATKRAKSARRQTVKATTWGRSHEREIERGEGPYETRYDIRLGYCIDRSIVVP